MLYHNRLLGSARALIHLSSEPVGSYGGKVLKGPQLASSEALAHNGQVLLVDATAVVLDEDALEPARVDGNLYRRGTRINAATVQTEEEEKAGIFQHAHGWTWKGLIRAFVFLTSSLSFPLSHLQVSV